MALSEIRSIRRWELPALLELYAHMHESDLPPPPEAELAALWQRIVDDPALHYFVAECDGRLVSSCALAVIPNLTRGGRPYGLIENVVTHAEYRRRGIASRVLREALAKCWKADCYKVMLLTGRKDPGVHAFYEALGFRSDDKTGFTARP